MMENEDSGFILAYKFKQRYPDMPVIISTAVASETGIEFCLGSSAEQAWIKADLYLGKGVKSEALKMAIEKFI
jgi:hypothetical protein